MTALGIALALAMECVCPSPAPETATARLERLRGEMRAAEHDVRMEQLAAVARRVNASNERKRTKAR